MDNNRAGSLHKGARDEPGCRRRVQQKLLPLYMAGVTVPMLDMVPRRCHPGRWMGHHLANMPVEALTIHPRSEACGVVVVRLWHQHNT